MNGKRLSIVLTVLGLAFCLASWPFSSSCRAEATPQNPLKIDFADWLPKVAPAGKEHVAFFTGLEQACGGAVKVNFHWAQSMGKASDLYGMTLDGIAQAANVVPAYTPGIFPMLSLFENPIQFPSSEVLTKAIVQFFDKGFLDKDTSQIKVVGLYTLNPYILQSVKYKITKIEDFKGLKFRASSPPLSKTVKALGGVSVQTTASGMYNNLSRGVYDVDISPYDSLLVFKTYEICKYISEWGMFTTDFIVAMNKGTWDALPQTGKNYIENNWKAYSVKCGKAYDAVGGIAKGIFLKQPGREIVQLAPGERDKMGRAIEPIWADWVTDMEGKGYKAKDAIKELGQILNGLGVEKPFVGYSAK